MDLRFKHITENPQPMSIVCPGIPTELDEPILEMLSKRPLGRPNSAGVAINALADAIRMASRMSRPPPTPPFGTPATALAATPAPALANVETVRTPMADAPPTLPNDTMRTEPMNGARPLPPVEPVRLLAEDSSRTHEAIPATRKSLTEFDMAAMAQKTPDSGNTEVASNPPIQSQMPATLASAPLTTVAVIDHVPEVKVVVANGGGKTTPTLPMTSRLDGSSKRSVFIAVGSVAMLLGAGVIFVRQPNPTPIPTTPEVVPSQTVQAIKPEPTTITLHVTVTPADAHIFVDGRDWKAGDAIVLPREKKQRAIRIERKGYESQTVWVPVDSDKQVGPIALALAVTPLTSASALASNKKPGTAPSASAKAVTTKTKVNKELYRPKEFGNPK